MSEKFRLIFSIVIGIIVLSIVVATEIKMKNDKVVNLRTIFIVVAVLGFCMCCIGKAVQVNGWANPIVIVCILLGIIALLVIILFLAGKFSVGDKVAFRILYSIIIVKWGLTTVHHIINLIK